MPAEACDRAPAREEELAFQADMLRRVSRTYALTIPRLPPGLREVVANAYLLCRIADTIEDEPGLPPARKEMLLRDFAACVAGRADADALAAKLAAPLSDAVPAGERALVENTARIARIMHAFPPVRRRAIERCLQAMTLGMIEFRRKDAGKGLRDLAELERYCHHVAGVVAIMLAELFCEYSPATAARRDALLALAPRYGQGLQMTNILKDIWADLARGDCWLPRELFRARGFDLDDLRAADNGPGFAAGFEALTAAAHHQLRQGLRFILLIPRRERGIRRHLLLTLAMAAATLRRLQQSEDFRRGGDVPPPQRAAPVLVVAVALLARSNLLLRGLFRVLLRKVPRSRTGRQAPAQPGEQQ